MTTTPARPDLAYVNATRAAMGRRHPESAGGQDLRRLRLAYQAATLLAERDHPAVIQAWFQGLNPALADRSPARLLREGDIDDVGPQVLTAARQFAAVG